MQYNKMMGYGIFDGNVSAVTNKTHDPTMQHNGFSGGKKEENAKPRTKWRGVSSLVL